MNFLPKLGCLLVLAAGVIFPRTLLAQGLERPGAAALTEQQIRGEGLYLQYCPLCHIGPTRRFQKKELGVPVVSHKGLFRRANPPSEEDVRRRLMQGNPGTMPSFRYTLTPQDMDDIIAYLKTL